MHFPFPDHCPFWCKMACASQNNNNKNKQLDQSINPAHQRQRFEPTEKKVT
jgi:hypothetical protein